MKLRYVSSLTLDTGRSYLAHHGIKGQKWGVRRFQNEDGSYTSAGKRRYRDSETGNPGSAESTPKKSNAGKKVAVGVAIGATAAAGAAVATYLLRKHGAKSISAIISNPIVVEAGKKAIETAKSTVGNTSVSAVKPSANKAPSGGYKITNNYDFNTLQKQNNDLLDQLLKNM